MANHIHIFGASGSGVTTFGSNLSEQVNGKFLDTDAFYWQDSDPPYQLRDSPEKRVALIERDISDAVYTGFYLARSAAGDNLCFINFALLPLVI